MYKRNKLFDLMGANARKGSVRAEGNTIYLYDFIAGSESEAQWFGGISAEGFSRMLAGMQGPVSLRIDSPGGAVFGGRAIAQAIREYDGEVTAHIDGVAASIASIIAIAADRVVAAPGAFMMIHRAWTITMGDCMDHRSEADLLDKVDGTLAKTYASKTGGNDADWLAAMTATTWYTAEEALAAGLIDEVATDAPTAQNRVKWDLSAYNVEAPTKGDDDADADEGALAEPADPEDPETIPPADPEDGEAGKDENENQAQTSAEQVAARQRRLTIDLLRTTA